MFEPFPLAAVDLGSNSFHMVIARALEHDIQILDRLREPVRLAGGLGPDGRLSVEARERAFACLQRFGQRLADLPSVRVRAVGTNTLRQLDDDGEFRREARRALGHPIEVISGQEEARLVYEGVAHIHHGPDRRLVVDIGGGSTEVILGHGFEVRRGHSFFMGCVSYSRRFFPDGILDRACFRAAQTAAGLELRTVSRQLCSLGWEAEVGTSGTIRAIGEVLEAMGLGQGEITVEGMKALRKAMIAAQNVDALDLPALKADRKPVLAGGLAILLATFKALELQSMSVSSGALREGLLYDLFGRIHHADIRDRTIRHLMEQYRVDDKQAQRVAQTASALLEESGPPPADVDAELGARLLAWAAQLHEIGLTVSWTGYHKHGAYLVENTDMPGFSSDDQRLMAMLLRTHRRKLTESLMSQVPEGTEALARRLMIVLRLAVLLHRSRNSKVRRPTLDIDPEGRTVRLTVADSWRREHPLTYSDLQEERERLQHVGIDCPWHAVPDAEGAC